MATINTNNDATGVLPKAYTSRASAAANTGRTFCGIYPVGGSTGQLRVSFGSDHGVGAGSIPVPADGLDSSAFAEFTQAAIYISGTVDGMKFSFVEIAAAASTITITP